MKSRYEYLAGRSIFCKYYSGLVSIDDVYLSWNELIESGTIPEGTRRFLVSYRDAELNFGISEATGIADYYRRHGKIFDRSKIAMVMVTPSQVVFPILVKQEIANLLVQTFFEESTALRWLSE